MRRNCFNPRSPRGGATPDQNDEWVHADVSIHAPRVGERRYVQRAIVRGKVFQSTLPAWGSDENVRRYSVQNLVSIHAPRVGERPKLLKPDKMTENVSIHAPRVGERPPVPFYNQKRSDVSIHATRVGERHRLRRRKLG